MPADSPITPPRLKPGDLARVVSFGLSLRGASQEQRALCNATLSKLGLRVSFGKHVDESDEFDSSSIERRLEDLHDALEDDSVKIVFAGLGGMNSGQLLRYVDWTLLRKRPKILCGFSDMASILNAGFSKSGVITYYGPLYGTLGMTGGAQYMLEAFKQLLFVGPPLTVEHSTTWSDDSWWLDQINRIHHPNPGPVIINDGVAEGQLLGGHLSSFSTLFGTEFMPDLTGSILMVEENSEITPRSFDRLLQTLIHQTGFANIQALLFGRFTSPTGIDAGMLTRILRSYPELWKVPIVANMSFGHTYPQFTFPIGGRGRIKAKNFLTEFEIVPS